MQPDTDLTNTNPHTEEEVFTFRKLAGIWVDNTLYAFRFWRLIILAGIIGASLGLAASWIPILLSPAHFCFHLYFSAYTARLTFVVEESKPGGGASMASALAGQFGFDLSSLSGTNGILAGDNVLELLKSHSLIKKTLLTAYKDSGSESLADVYAEKYKWKQKWAGDSKIGKQVNFPVDQKTFSRLEDSLLQVITTRIVEVELSIAKPDKKLGFFELQLTTRDERLSDLMCERLLKIATDFYVDTKTRRLSNNVARLQRRADSLGILLDKRTYSAAETNQLLLDANPAYSGPTVNAEISTRNKYIEGVVYSEIIKNLEASKTALVQETPTVQIVDYPELPLKENQLHWYFAALIGAITGIVLTTLFFASRRRK